MATLQLRHQVSMSKLPGKTAFLKKRLMCFKNVTLLPAGTTWNKYLKSLVLKNLCSTWKNSMQSIIFFSWKNKTWHVIWINCLADRQSHLEYQALFPQKRKKKILGPVVQSIISLSTWLESTISNSVILLKNVGSFCKCKCKSYSHLFSKNICVYAILNDQSFNNKLTNDIVSF